MSLIAEEWDDAIRKLKLSPQVPFQVRCPVQDTDWIDNMVGYGTYGSRPEFVAEALRLFSFDVINEIRKYWPVIIVKTDNKESQFSSLKELLSEKYKVEWEISQTRSKSIQITTRTLPGIFETMKKIDLIGFEVGPLKFTRMAVHWNVNELKKNLQIKPEEYGDVWANDHKTISDKLDEIYTIFTGIKSAESKSLLDEIKKECQ